MNTYFLYPNKYLLILFIIASFSFLLLSEEEDFTIEEIRELQELKTGEDVILEEEKFLELQTSVKREEEIEPCLDCIYGYNLFSETPTTFALSTNIPIPQDYILGPGDKIKIEYFGINKDKSESFISRAGSINLPLLGPVTIAGQDFRTAREFIKKRVNEELIGTEVFISLSNLRSINVYVVGAAYKPGTFTVSSLASLTNIIFSTGGPSKVGSLRNIQVKRNGKVLKQYDFYKLLLEGDTSQDMRLQEGDTIFYPLIESTVMVSGAVQRPGNYEILDGSTLSSIFKFSGLQKKDSLQVQHSRYVKSSNRREVSFYNSPEDWQEILLSDGDSINLSMSSKQDRATVYLSGQFVYPGYYDVSEGQTISQIIKQAGGFTDSAYPEGAIFTRESVKKQQKESYLKNAQNLEMSLLDAMSSGKEIDVNAYTAINLFIDKLKEQEPLGRQVASVDEYSLQSDPRSDFTLQEGDTLFVPKRSSSVSVVGEVLNASTLLYREDLDIQDYIDLAGGITAGADKSRIFVILPNGQSMVYKRKLFQNDISQNLLPGSTIVVSRNPNPLNWLQTTTLITPILSDLAISVASLSAISNDN